MFECLIVNIDILKLKLWYCKERHRRSTFIIIYFCLLLKQKIKRKLTERCYDKLIISKIFFKFRIRNFRIKFESFEFGKIEFENFKFETFEFETTKFECFEFESFKFESFEFENIEFHFFKKSTFWGFNLVSPFYVLLVLFYFSVNFSRKLFL